MDLAATYPKATQIRTNIRPHLLPVDNIAAPFCVSTHGAGAVAFVVVVGALFGGEGEAADCAGEGGGWVHFGVMGEVSMDGGEV